MFYKSAVNLFINTNTEYNTSLITIMKSNLHTSFTTELTLTEPYFGILYSSGHTNKTLHWHVFAILRPHLKNQK